MQQAFQSDNAPFVGALKDKAGFAAYEHGAGDSARLLGGSHWSSAAQGDINQLRSIYQSIASAGHANRAVDAGIGKWAKAYNRAAADLQLPPQTLVR